MAPLAHAGFALAVLSILPVASSAGQATVMRASRHVVDDWTADSRTYVDEPLEGDHE